MRFNKVKDQRRRTAWEGWERPARLVRASRKRNRTKGSSLASGSVPAPARWHNRCVITGRSGGVYREWRRSRAELRRRARRGEVSGRAKRSW